MVVNADDFGLAPGVNRGILEAHREGIVTSASLMVDAPAGEDAVRDARGCPNLELGLHLVLPDVDEPRQLRREVVRQLDAFHRLVGRPPTHVDSHHHAHRREPAASIVVELAAPERLPVRWLSGIRHISSFYGRWEGRSHPEQVSAESLARILTEEAEAGINELGCHPGYVDDVLTSSYAHERELEVRALTEPSVRMALEAAGIELIGFAEATRRAGAGAGR